MKLNLIGMPGRTSQRFWQFMVGTLVVAIGILDAFTGYEISVFLFYLLPIVLAVWFVGRWLGYLVSLACAAAWTTADMVAGHTYSRPGILVWNAFILLVSFLIVVALLPLLKALEREKQLARTDYLTRVVNRLSFFEAAQRELESLRRYGLPMTLAYFDLDNFKALNDRFGHAAGDDALRAVADQLKSKTRKTDVVGRLGGDEFVVLLPQTGQEGARVALARLRRQLLEAVERKGWPATYSIGVLTCLEAPESVDDLIRRGDDLMYSAKNSGKNAARFGIYPGESHPVAEDPLRIPMSVAPRSP